MMDSTDGRSESLRWEALDRYGNRIYLTSERWRHATEQRPWLAVLTVWGVFIYGKR